MATTIVEDKQVQYSPVLEGDVVAVAKAIHEADKAKKAADALYEERLLSTPVIYASKMADTDIAKKSGLSKAQIAIYRRTGRVMSYAPSAGIKPSEIATLINTLHNAPGSSGANIDPHLGTYQTECDNPTWAGAVAYLKKMNKVATTPKTDEEKVTNHLKAVIKLQESKGYQLTDEQKSLAAQINK